MNKVVAAQAVTILEYFNKAKAIITGIIRKNLNMPSPSAIPPAQWLLFKETNATVSKKRRRIESCPWMSAINTNTKDPKKIEM